MTNENDLDSVTIRVDRTRGVTLDHVCARCGATAKSIPISYDSFDPDTGGVDSAIFRVRNAMPPEGWEHLRMTDPEKTWHLEVCPTCIRKFFLEKK